MEWSLALTLLLGLIFFFLGMNLPVAMAFFTVNAIGAWIFLGGENGMIQSIRNTVPAIGVFSLTPIPMFVLMGEVLFQTNMAARAISAVDRLITRVPGRLSMVAIGSGTVFSALSGSSMGTTAMLGATLLPEMRRRGYHTSMSAGPILGTGGLAVLIPPSGLAVLLGSLAGISIADLLVGGIVPGLMLAVMFAAYVLVRCTRNPALAPSYPVEEMPLWERWRPFVVHVLPLLLLFVVVIGGLLSGLATPTESAAVGSVAAILIALAYRQLTWTNLIKAFKETAKITVMILMITGASTTFAQILVFSGATPGLLSLLTSFEMSRFELILVVILILLFLGCLLDPISMMLLTLPFFMPLGRAVGIDLVWMGVIMLIMLELSFITPPFGVLLFVMRGLSPPEVTSAQIYAAALPFVLLQLIAIALILAVPDLVTWLPDLAR
jgi:tripartite ATP-independent transporter DctM subunit